MGVGQIAHGRATLEAVAIPGAGPSPPARGRAAAKTVVRLIGVATPLVGPPIAARIATARAVAVAAASDASQKTERQALLEQPFYGVVRAPEGVLQLPEAETAARRANEAPPGPEAPPVVRPRGRHSGEAE